MNNVFLLDSDILCSGPVDFGVDKVATQTTNIPIGLLRTERGVCYFNSRFVLPHGAFDALFLLKGYFYQSALRQRVLSVFVLTVLQYPSLRGAGLDNQQMVCIRHRSEGHWRGGEETTIFHTYQVHVAGQELQNKIAFLQASQVQFFSSQSTSCIAASSAVQKAPCRCREHRSRDTLCSTS